MRVAMLQLRLLLLCLAAAAEPASAATRSRTQPPAENTALQNTELPVQDPHDTFLNVKCLRAAGKTDDADRRRADLSDDDSASLSSLQPPLCMSCADWCAGRCAFAGPAGKPRVRQNLTVYRMTAANVTQLDDKNSGDRKCLCFDLYCWSCFIQSQICVAVAASGDLIFNMAERVLQVSCRHAKNESNGRPSSGCGGTNTGGWLLQNSLVYTQWEIEVD